MDAAPVLYGQPLEAARLTLPGRLLAAGIALGCLVVLLTAAWLRPSPTGISSHRQLGLQPCQFEFQTGLPCPTCGMTTSFSHFVRGQIPASLYVQPMGTVLALLTSMGVWAGMYIAITGRPAHRLVRLIPARYYLFPLFALTILAWVWKMWIHVNGRDGWH